jgi:hypothetical protein
MTDQRRIGSNVPTDRKLRPCLLDPQVAQQPVEVSSYLTKMGHDTLENW